MKQLKGIYTALLTPFTKEGKINEKELARLVYHFSTFSGVSMGADGGVGSTYNFMADKFVLIRKLFLEGKMEEARAVQQEANRIITVLCKIGVMQAEKEVMNQLGFGDCLSPVCAPRSDCEPGQDLFGR